MDSVGCKGGIWGGGMRQLILSMGQVWVEVNILVQRATSPSTVKGFHTTHVYNTIVCAVKMLFVLLTYFLLWGLKINHMTEIRKHAFILGPNRIVANTSCSA